MTLQESHAGCQFLNTVIFNVMVKQLCQEILIVEDSCRGVTLQYKSVTWPTKQAVHAALASGELSRGESDSSAEKVVHL